MKLPPLSYVPHLRRLLGPGEEIIYTAKLHPLHQSRWLAGALAFLALAVVWCAYMILPAVFCAMVYGLPFRNTEIAVTNYRLLLRRGRFHIHLDAIDSEHLDHYQLHQTAFTDMLHYGTVVLNLKSSGGMHAIELPQLWHPMTFLAAITTLNPTFRGSFQAN